MWRGPRKYNKGEEWQRVVAPASSRSSQRGKLTHQGTGVRGVEGGLVLHVRLGKA